MSDALLRRLALLQFMPVYPRKTSTRKLLQHLEKKGYCTTMRTVQRDLEYLSGSGIFGIGVDSNSKPAGWYWLKESKAVLLPNMDVPTAIAYKVISNDANRLFPQSVVDHLTPFFEQADQLLKNRSEWNSKIAWVNSASKEYINSTIDYDSQEIIYEALDRGVCIAAGLGRFFDSTELTYIYYDCIHPLGIVLSENVSYLLAKLGGSSKVYYLPIHRIINAVILCDTTIRPENFDLNEFIDRHPLTMVFQKKIELVLRVDRKLANYLAEHPIGEDQKIIELEDHRYSVAVTVDDTSTLRTLILSFGSSVMIVKPDSLQAFVQRELGKTLEMYVYN